MTIIINHQSLHCYGIEGQKYMGQKGGLVHKIKMKTIDQKIEETDKLDWLYIPELEIAIQKKTHHKGKIYAECEKDLSKGEAIPTYAQIQWLRNSKYKDQLNLDDAWEFVQNPDNISKENGYVAWFYANSDYAHLYCDRNSSNSVSGLEVRFVRKKILGGKKK